MWKRRVSQLDNKETKALKAIGDVMVLTLLSISEEARKEFCDKMQEFTVSEDYRKVPKVKRDVEFWLNSIAGFAHFSSSIDEYNANVDKQDETLGRIK